MQVLCFELHPGIASSEKRLGDCDSICRRFMWVSVFPTLYCVMQVLMRQRH